MRAYRIPKLVGLYVGGRDWGTANKTYASNNGTIGQNRKPETLNPKSKPQTLNRVKEEMLLSCVRTRLDDPEAYLLGILEHQMDRVPLK